MPGDDGPVGARRLSRGLVRLMVATQHAYAQAGRELDLTPQQAELLCLARGGAAVGALAGAMACDRSNVTRMVDRMRDRGLLERRRDERDGRVAVIGLTAAGERRMSRFVEALETRLEAGVADWPERRRARALAVLDDLAGALEPEPPQARTNPGGDPAGARLAM